MSIKKIKQTVNKFEKMDVYEQPIEVVLRNGERKNLFYKGVSETGGVYCLDYISMKFDGDYCSKLEDMSSSLPLYKIGCVKFPEEGKKISAMAFQNAES